MSPCLRGESRDGRVVLVTGGAGFIGSHVVDALLAQGWQVVVIDDLSSGSLANLPPGAEFQQIDITSPALEHFFGNRRFDAVVHCAAQVKVDKSMADPAWDRAVNVVGTASLLSASRAAGVQRFVFVSTGGAIYGETRVPATEDTLPRPISYYAIHKYTAERYVELSGLSYAILRLANVYGPRQRSDLEGGVVSIFMDRLLQKQPVHIFGSGEQLRDFVYVKDVVSVVLACLEDERSGLWNVGTGVLTSVNELLAILAAALGPPVEVHHGPARPGDIFRSCLDVSRIIGDGLWRPAFSMEDGIRDMLQVIAQG